MEMDKIKALVDYDDDEEVSSDDCPTKCLPEKRLQNTDISCDTKKQTHITNESPEKTALGNNKLHQSSKNELNDHDKLKSNHSNRSCSSKSEHQDYNRTYNERHKHHKRHHHRDSPSHDDDRYNRRGKYQSKSHHRYDDQDNHRESRRHRRSRSRSPNKEKCSDSKSYRKSDDELNKIRNREDDYQKSCKREQTVSSIDSSDSTKIEQKSGISVPKYYNPAVINPLKFAEQEKKRKLLWSKTETEESTYKVSSMNVWQNLKFDGDQGNMMTEKFRKLMGIKGQSCDKPNIDNKSSKGTCETKTQTQNLNALENQNNLFKNLDMQYAVARMSTHTHRGVGLGFSSSVSSSSSILPKHK